MLTVDEARLACHATYFGEEYGMVVGDQILR
jgi:hypothetical protein